MEVLNAIDKRYTGLSEKTCCLSCGGAINHAHVSPGEICLDLGSGKGNDVIRMAQAAGDNGFAYGVDISQGMLDKARRNAEKLGVTNVEFIESPIDTIPLEDNSVQVVISNCTINHAPDKLKVWSEIFRVLAPGGRFAVSDIYSLTEVPEEFASDPAAVAECWAGSVTREIYMETLKKAGFKDIMVAEESAPYPKGSIEVCSFTICGRKE